MGVPTAVRSSLSLAILFICVSQRLSTHNELVDGEDSRHTARLAHDTSRQLLLECTSSVSLKLTTYVQPAVAGGGIWAPLARCCFCRHVGSRDISSVGCIYHTLLSCARSCCSHEKKQSRRIYTAHSKYTHSNHRLQQWGRKYHEELGHEDSCTRCFSARRKRRGGRSRFARALLVLASTTTSQHTEGSTQSTYFYSTAVQEYE